MSQAWDFRDILRLFCLTGAGHRTLFQSFSSVCGRLGTFSVNSDDVLKGSKVAICETVVFSELGHDDDSMWQMQKF